MKRTISLLLLFLSVCLFLCTACAEEPAPAESTAVSFSEPESVSEISAPETQGGIWLPVKVTNHSPVQSTETYEYGENGLPTRITTVYAMDGREEVTLFTYDQDQHLLEQVTTDEEGNEVAYIRQTYRDGKLTSKTQLEAGSSRERTTLYTYDEKGRITKEEPSDGIGEILTYIYEEDGSYTVSFADGYTLLYNSQGDVLRSCNKDGELTEEYLYDECNRLLTYKQYIAEEVSAAYRFHYDEKGNLSKREYFSYDDLMQTLLYGYDEHGNNISLSVLSGGNEMTVVETEYAFFS